MRTRSRDLETGAATRRVIAPGAVGYDELDLSVRPGSGLFRAGVTSAVRDNLSSGDLPDGVVEGRAISPETIDGPNVRPGALSSRELAEGAVGAEELSAIYVEVGKFIRSFDYDPNDDLEDRTGWAIDGDGNAEFHDVTIRGGSMVGADLYSSSFESGVSGWAILQDGTAELNNAVVRGELIAAGGEVSLNGSGLRLSISGGASSRVTWGDPSDDVFIEGALDPTETYERIDVVAERIRLGTPSQAGGRIDIWKPVSALVGVDAESFGGVSESDGPDDLPRGMSWKSVDDSAWPGTGAGLVLTLNYGDSQNTHQEFTDQNAPPARFVRRWALGFGWTTWREL